MKRLLISLIAVFAFATISKAQCDATFTYTNIDCDSVWFIPISFGSQYTYMWDFGDGNSSTDASPAHQYASDGTYLVILYLVDTVAPCSNVSTLPIVINCGGNCTNAISSAWTWVPDSLGCEANFVSTVMWNNPPYSYYWEFGDGTTSTLANPSHAYSPFGAYNVCLTITDGNGCDTTMCQFISVGCAASCDASFVHTTLGCDSIFFNPNSVGSQYTYEWHFGDGNISNDPFPAHTYAADGTYTAYLVLQDTVSGCTDVFTSLVTVNCSSPCSVNGAWTLSIDSSGCGAQFVSTAFGGTAPYNYYWDFGDGNSSTSSNPIHAFSPLGPWYVCLTITDANGCDTAICQWVTLGCAPTSCNAVFTHTNISCNELYFYPASTGPQYTYLWNFGDGNTSTSADPNHTYATDGIYVVQLTVTDTVAGCSADYLYTILINCGTTCTVNGAFAWNVDTTTCEVNFVSTAFGGQGTYTYYWNFGDGNFSTSPNPIHQYPNGSVYTPCLTITDANGCDTTICNVVTVNCSPTSCDAVFTFTYLGCDQLYFFPASNGPQYTYLWDFGDGNSSTQLDPTHTFVDGIHVVTLTVTDSLSGCSDTFWYTLTIDCGFTPCNTNGAISWAVDTSNCNVQFVSTAFGGTAPYTYYWNFGDGNTSTSPNPIHQYPNGSVYTPCLTITDVNGCDTTICEVVNVSCNSTSCDATHTHTYVSCDSVWFVPVIQDPSYDYFWDFGDGNTSTEISPVHPYVSNGTYIVVLYISDSLNGCYHAHTSIVNINCGASPCNVQAVTTWTFDSLDCSVYMVSSVWGGQAPYSYYWTFGDGATSADPHPTHQYPSAGPWTPCLTVTDANGCDTVVCMVVSPLCTSGIEELLTFDIEVYPNPSSGRFNILIPNDATISVYDITGKLVYVENSQKTDGIFQLDLSDQTDGIYILQVSTSFGIATKKLLIE